MGEKVVLMIIVEDYRIGVKCSVPHLILTERISDGSAKMMMQQQCTSKMRAPRVCLQI